MRILVTVGAGFIGSHLVEKLLESGYGVAILDDFNDFMIRNQARQHCCGQKTTRRFFRSICGTTTPCAILLHREKFVCHRAPGRREPAFAIYRSAATLLRHQRNRHAAFARRGPGRRNRAPHFGSSSSVYGICKTVPFSEDFHLTQTISPYAATPNRGSEFLCSTFSQPVPNAHDRMRFFTVYGARQRPRSGDPVNSPAKFWPTNRSTSSAMATTRRDYTHIDDIIQGVIAALKLRRRDVGHFLILAKTRRCN